MIIREKIFDLSTNEETIIERQETEQETKERLEFVALLAKEQEEASKKAKARVALLERLGITEEEAKLLLG